MDWRMDSGTKEQTTRWTEGRKDGRTEGRKDGRTDVKSKGKKDVQNIKFRKYYPAVIYKRMIFERLRLVDISSGK